MSRIITDKQLDDWESGIKSSPVNIRSWQNCLVLECIDEIRRQREVIRKGNHCVDCGKLNPIDNVCDDCLEAERVA